MATDALSVLISGMQKTNELLIAKANDNPMLEMYKLEIARLQSALEKPQARDKQDLEDRIDLAVRAAGASGGWMAALAPHLADPLKSLATTFAETGKARAEIELTKARTAQLEAAVKAQSAGLDVTPAPAAEAQAGTESKGESTTP